MWRVQPEGQALVVPIPDGLDPTRALRSVERLLDKQPITRFPGYKPVGTTDKRQIVVRGLGYDTTDIQRFGGEIERAWTRAANWRRYKWVIGALVIGLLALLLAAYGHAGPWSPWKSVGEVNEESGTAALGSMRVEPEDRYGVEAALIPDDDGRIACQFRYWYLAEVTDEGYDRYKSMTNKLTHVATYPLMRIALQKCRQAVERKLDLAPANTQP